MNTAYKKVYFNKSKKAKNSNIKSDPITNGIRTAILSKIDSIYEQIARLHNQNSPLKKAPTIKLSVSAPKIADPEHKTITERAKLSTNSSERKTYSCSLKCPSFSNSKLVTATSFYTQKKPSVEYRSPGYRCPPSHCRVRQLLKVKTKLQQDENQNVTKNPYYKIMKKRFKTQVEPQKQLSSGSEHQNSLLCKQYLNDKQQDHLLSNKYSEDLTEQKKDCLLDESPKMRQKSQTKVYQEIKKYFEEKYGSGRKTQRD